MISFNIFIRLLIFVIVFIQFSIVRQIILVLVLGEIKLILNVCVC